MSEKRSKKEIAKRYILFIISLFFSGLGIALTKHSELGVSPISSVPNILSCKFEFFTMGTWLIIWNFLMIFAQILILKRNFKAVDLLQFPLTLIFGYFTDFGLLIASPIPGSAFMRSFGSCGFRLWNCACGDCKCNHEFGRSNSQGYLRRAPSGFCKRQDYFRCFLCYTLNYYVASFLRFHSCRHKRGYAYCSILYRYCR